MGIKRYDDRLLGLLLDKYERSRLYTDGAGRRQSISIPVNDVYFPEYLDETSMEFDVIHHQFLALRDRGYIDLAWKDGCEGHILQKCILRPAHAEELYRHLKRMPKREKEERFLHCCEKLLEELEQKQPRVCITFIRTMAERVQNNQSIKSWCDLSDPASFEKLCRLIQAIEANDREQFIREFSVRFYNDSKIAEKEIHRAVQIIKEFSGSRELAELEAEQILEEYHIYRNPTWVMMKGRGRFQIRKGEDADETDIRSGYAPGRASSREVSHMLCLEDFPGGLGVASEDIGKIVWDNTDNTCVPERIVTCENLTSFHRWSDEKTLLIYLGGYHNHVKRAFLVGLREAWGDRVSFYHFGDIDAGGFKIWKNLCRKTGIPFIPYRMDTEVYEQYKRFGRPLTAGDRRELTKMQQDPFFDGQKKLFEAMLRDGIKLEQECVS